MEGPSQWLPKISSIRGPNLDAAITQQRIGHMTNVINFMHKVSEASTWISTKPRDPWITVNPILGVAH